MNNAEQMRELAESMWGYMRPKVAEMLNKTAYVIRAEVQSVGETTMTVMRAGDPTALSLPYSASLAGAAAGDQVLVLAIGGLTNAFVLCKTDFSNL